MNRLWSASAQLDERGRRSLKLLKQLPERMKLMERWVTYELAQRMHDEVVEGIPTGKAHSRYRKSIVLRRVLVPGGRTSFSVSVDPKASGVKEVDPATLVVFVKSRRRRLRRPPPQIRVLERYNPWTLDTLPFLPGRDEAVIVSRPVSPQEVQAVAEARRRDASIWKTELARTGSIVRKKDKLSFPKQAGSIVPDVMFEGLRLERGLSGAKATPHWRPALVKTVQSARRLALQRRSVVVKLLSDPNWSGRSLVPRVKGLQTTQARKFRAFQELIGVHRR